MSEPTIVLKKCCGLLPVLVSDNGYPGACRYECRVCSRTTGPCYCTRDSGHSSQELAADIWNAEIPTPLKKEITLDLPQILLALAKPVVAKYGCGVEVTLGVNTKTSAISWQVWIESRRAEGNGKTFNEALAQASEGLETVAEKIEQLRAEARSKLQQAEQMEKKLS